MLSYTKVLAKQLGMDEICPPALPGRLYRRHLNGNHRISLAPLSRVRVSALPLQHAPIAQSTQHAKQDDPDQCGKAAACARVRPRRNRRHLCGDPEAVKCV